MTQTAFYKTFGGSAPENYEKYFVPSIGRPLASDLMDTASLQPGERVLDVACGTGIIARLAAERVGSTGSVAGLDLNPGMLEVARSVAPAGYSIEWHQSSAESMPLDDEQYDVVLCQLGLQFMEDKPAAVREMYRVLTRGGRLALSVGGPTPEPFEIFADIGIRSVHKDFPEELAYEVTKAFIEIGPVELKGVSGALRLHSARRGD
jgi:ubiquinone/menaquinone biosynthesis C-methylase UbiE